MHVRLRPSPGDSINSCQLGVTYSGTAPAFVALDVKIEGPTNNSLYYGDNSHGLTFTVTDGEGSAKTFTVPTGAGYQNADCGAGDTCWKAVDLLAASNSGSSPDANSTTFNSGDTATWTVQPTFPASVGQHLQQRRVPGRKHDDHPDRSRRPEP